MSQSHICACIQTSYKNVCNSGYLDEVAFKFSYRPTTLQIMYFLNDILTPFHVKDRLKCTLVIDKKEGCKHVSVFSKNCQKRNIFFFNNK